MSENNNRCPQCTDECVGMCAKDWHPLDDNYNPANAIFWFGWCIVAMLCGAFIWWVLS